MVNFMCQCCWGHRTPRQLVKHFLDVSVRLLPKRLAFKSEEWVSIVLTNAGQHHPIHWRSKQKKKGGGMANLLSACPETSMLLFLELLVLGPLDSNLYHWPLISQTLGLRLNYITSFPGPPPLQRADYGTSWLLLPWEPLPAINLFSSPLSLHTVS